MDVCCKTITLHPQAHDILFRHFRTLIRIFNDVLGLLEIDYMAIAVLNSQNELLFLSSRPSIECNLVEQNLWPFDGSFQYDFFIQSQARLWEDLYPDEWRKPLHHYKQASQRFSMGISVPAIFENYRVVYSFALKSNDTTIKNKIINNIETLSNMGKFCLQKILKVIPLPDRQENKPLLKLVINNEVKHGHTA
jgi:hypothetical protein